MVKGISIKYRFIKKILLGDKSAEREDISDSMSIQ